MGIWRGGIGSPLNVKHFSWRNELKKSMNLFLMMRVYYLELWNFENRLALLFYTVKLIVITPYYEFLNICSLELTNFIRQFRINLNGE
jgi:hypothetical protein